MGRRNRRSRSRGKHRTPSGSRGNEQEKSPSPIKLESKGLEQENVIDSTGEKIQDIFADESPVSKLHNVTEESKALQAEKEKNVAISLEKEYSKEKSEEKRTVMEPRYDRVR